MKHVYVDEAGTSENEFVTLVVGAIVDADKQAKVLEEHLTSVKEKYIPEEDRENFIFHATEIFHGKRYFSDRKIWDFEIRTNILQDIMSVFMRYQIPLAIGYYVVPKHEKPIPIMIRHAMAYMECLSSVERYMRHFEDDTDKALIIAENHPTMKIKLDDIHQHFFDVNSNPIQWVESDIIPIKHLSKELCFAKKEEAALLQITDAFAFMIRRYLDGGNRVEKIMEFAFPVHEEFFRTPKEALKSKTQSGKLFMKFRLYD